MALRRNIGQLLPNGQVADGGKERTVASGRIDIVVRDENGSTVVLNSRQAKRTEMR